MASVHLRTYGGVKASSSRDPPGRERPEHPKDQGIPTLALEDHGEVRSRPAVFPGDLPEAPWVHPIAPVRLEMREDTLPEPRQCCALTW